MTNYIGIEEVLAIHDRIIKETGGKPGIFSFTLLHSSVERPKATFGGLDLYPSIFEKVAALIHSLIQNHPFDDGNKRTALAATVRFLRINGYLLKHPVEETVNFTLNIQKKQFTFEKISGWLKKHSILVRKF
ncbi:type II toxin-antitoxin system death-on-curing family toxin [Candidatus Gottesmanbacteria bacterium]|nr:type II toxin-antitoxin system death-on-curing family toxin [Candidatus Gottesmanbacteria bacterium]